MQKRFLLALGACLLGLLTAGSAWGQTTVTGVNITKYEATSVETQPKVFITPLAADLSIIQAASTSFKTQGTIVIPDAPDTKDTKVLERYSKQVRETVVGGIEELKAKALFEFSEQVNADVIVAPTYSVITDRSEGKVVHVTIRVKGYPARYTNFRNVKASDTTLVYINRLLSVGKDVKILTSAEVSQDETVK